MCKYFGTIRNILEYIATQINEYFGIFSIMSKYFRKFWNIWNIKDTWIFIRILMQCMGIFPKCTRNIEMVDLSFTF